MANAYTVLGLSAKATGDEIAAAFRAKSIEYHPDRATSDADRAARTAKMSRLTLAWRYLGDPEARAEYDRKLADLEGVSPGAVPLDNHGTIDFLGRIRSTSRVEAGEVAEQLCRAAGLQGRELDRAREAAQKTVDVAKNMADLIGLVRTQR